MKYSRFKNKYNILTIIFLIFILFIPIVSNAYSDINLSNEEIEYIKLKDTIKVGAIKDAAPLHDINSKGEEKGISISILNYIGSITGLKFEYYFYDSVSDTFNSPTDMILAATPKYAPENLILSDTYLEAETVLYMNRKLDSDKIKYKTYSHVEGGKLPNGIKVENIKSYPTRLASMEAVEKGEAGYGYGNEYSVMFYIGQNEYKNIITVPMREEHREYSFGFFKDDPILLSIINKSIQAIDKKQMESFVLEIATTIERRLTFSVIYDTYGNYVIGLMVLIIGLIVWGVYTNLKHKKELKLKNEKYEKIFKISRECLFEYFVKEGKLKLSNDCHCHKYINKFQDEFKKEIKVFSKELIENNTNQGNFEFKVSIENGNNNIFKITCSVIFDTNKKINMVIGKIIDISDESSKIERLIEKAEIDELTQIYNTATTKELIINRLNTKDYNTIDAIIMFDGDKFKNINDNYGHLAGDRALQHISYTLKSTFRNTDIIGRVGGDEFLVYMIDIPSSNFVYERCEHVLKLMDKMDEEFKLSLSIGIRIIKGNDDFKDVFQGSDEAMYISKRKGGKGITVFGE